MSTAPRGVRDRRARRVNRLAALELAIGSAAVAGGLLLVAAPDGSLLHANVSALARSPFPDWRIPGVLLGCLVGGGYLWSAWWLWRRNRCAAEISIAAGIGLVAFELTEAAWIGFQPLEAVFAGLGIAVSVIAVRVRGRSARPSA
jgi:hypothetical protein